MQARVTERPSGGLLIGSHEHFRWLHVVVKSVLVLNLFDAVFTLLWVQAGLASEANPLIAELVNDHAVLFVVVTLSLVFLGSALLWRRRGRPISVIGIFAVFVAYYLILLYHLQYASGLIRGLLTPQ